MGKGFRDARARKKFMKAWAEILGGIGLAIAAEPIHEGHAIATRMVTGVWPEIGLWAVTLHPVSRQNSMR